MMKSFIRENPGLFIQLSAQRLFLTYNRETMGIVWNLRFPLAVCLTERNHGGQDRLDPELKGALALAISGLVLVLMRERWRALFHPGVMFWAYFAAVHAVTQASDRYHLPSVP